MPMQPRANGARLHGLPAAVLLAALAFTGVPAAAANAALAPGVVEDFLARQFPPAAGAAAPGTLWLTPETRARVVAAGGVTPPGARVTYWRSGKRTAWVLDRVGKEAPISFGVVIEDDAVVALEVLAYRESRGFEIRSARWLARFRGLRPGPQEGFDRRIDNITGATLSVRAARDVTRLALALHRTMPPDGSP